MSNRMQNMKEITDLFVKAKGTEDPGEKKELMKEFWTEAIDHTNDLTENPPTPSGFIAAEQINRMKF